ncbi:hypothetical protein IQ06DRAFT_306654 [Phaeosphaeriaceae sp. SRC1lsM3a]|nr:hypothetical protein IQ06DRAFT_306654 [Stagonospora sp. SRC1lsM3a]
MALSSSSTRAMPVFGGFTMFELGMAIVVPASCIAFTLGAFLVTYRQNRDADVDAEAFGGFEKDRNAAEVRGDTVEMFVELEAREDLGSPKRKKLHKEVRSGDGLEKI